jgi:hypothetical protein
VKAGPCKATLQICGKPSTLVVTWNDLAEASMSVILLRPSENEKFSTSAVMLAIIKFGKGAANVKLPVIAIDVRCSWAARCSKSGHGQQTSAYTNKSRVLKRSSAAVATSREIHRQQRSGREALHRRWDRARHHVSAIKWCASRCKVLAALHADVNDPPGQLARPTGG